MIKQKHNLNHICNSFVVYGIAYSSANTQLCLKNNNFYKYRNYTNI